MSLTVEQLLANLDLHEAVRDQSRALLQVNDETPRLAAVFGTQQRWLLGISASDRAGLLYLVARVLARHGLSVQLAKVSTLGERVEDTFLVQGPELQNNLRQIEIETELLHALSA